MPYYCSGVGIFTRLLEEIAVKLSKYWGIILTHRNNGGDRTELAGFHTIP